jgi:surfactin synthase thioesterase subunit
MTRPNPWLIGRARSEAELRLFCFPWAGGSPAAFMAWQQQLPSSIEIWGIQLPGRGSRLRESALVRFDEVTDALVHVIAPFANLPFAFFGHSLGAIVAYELAQRLRDRSLPLPFHLIASAAMAPSLPRRRMRPEEFDDARLIETLERYGGTPAAALRDPQLLALVLPALRGDFTLLDGYQYRARAPLPLPVTVFAGRSDPGVTPDKLTDWYRETTFPPSQYWFDGGHFYLQEAAAPELLERLQAILLARAATDAIQMAEACSHAASGDTGGSA